MCRHQLYGINTISGLEHTRRKSTKAEFYETLYVFVENASQSRHYVTAAAAMAIINRKIIYLLCIILFILLYEIIVNHW